MTRKEQTQDTRNWERTYCTIAHEEKRKKITSKRIIYSIIVGKLWLVGMLVTNQAQIALLIMEIEAAYHDVHIV